MRGTPRKVDVLGRVVLPAEMRHKLGWEAGTEVSVSLDGGAMLLEKPEPECALCRADAPLVIISGKHLCTRCVTVVQQIVLP